MVLIGIVINVSNTKNDSARTVTPITVNNISPERTLDLKPGSTQSFRINFQAPIDPGKLAFSLSYFDLTQDLPPVAVEITMVPIDPQTISVKTTTSIKPRGKYTLTITEMVTKKLILETSYLSGDIPSTPAPSSNPALVQYLPYETSSFKLSYLRSGKTYIFNFKYNSSRAGTVSQQFEQAKTDALNFVKSKGIDPLTLVIDFRRK